MKKITERIKLFATFFLSTLPLNLPVSILIGVISTVTIPGAKEITITLIINNILLNTSTFGLLIDLGYKELTRKEEYYYYFNASLSKPILFATSFAAYFAIYILFRLIITPS